MIKIEVVLVFRPVNMSELVHRPPKVYTCFNTLPKLLHMLVSVCRSMADICILVDSSGSITKTNPNNYNVLKNFVKSIVNGLQIGRYDARVSVVKFSNEASVEFLLNRYYSKSEVSKGHSVITYL